MRLGVVQIEALRSSLLELSQLANEVEREPGGSLDSMQRWLRSTERLCQGLGLAATGDLAALRAQLVQAGRGVACGVATVAGKVTRRKIRGAALAHAIARSNEVIQSAMRARAVQLEECERIASQIAAVINAKGYVGVARVNPSHDGYLAALQALIEADPDLLSAWTHLVGIAGPHDAKILLDRTLP